jgi:hypothetical protein
MEVYQSITPAEIREITAKLLTEANCSELVYEPVMDEIQ